MGSKERTFRFEIEGVDHEALGVARVDGVELKIPGTATGDKGIAREVHRSPHRPVAWCEVVKIISRGEAFRTPACPHAYPVNGRCGGCPAMHLTQAAAREMKLDLASRALSGSALDQEITWTESPLELGYRCRGQFVAASTKEGILLGSYAPRSHDVVSMAGCPVLRRGIDEAATVAAEELQASGVPVYPRRGGLRHVTIRADREGRCLVDLVFFAAPSPATLDAAAALLGKGGIEGVSWSRNDDPGNAIRTAPSVLLAGKGTVIERVGEVDLEMNAETFSQLNSDTAGLMYERAARALEAGEGPLWDLYCGVGGLGLTAARRSGGPLFGAESLEGSVKLARLNANRASIEASFEKEDLGRRVPTGWPAPGRIAVNPPRRGLDAPVLECLATTPARTLAYMSCNPISFARDATSLLGSGWSLRELHAHDMLPNTTHTELLAVLRR